MFLKKNKICCMLIREFRVGSYAVVELLIFSHDVSSVSKSRLLFQFKSNTANECNDERAT